MPAINVGGHISLGRDPEAAVREAAEEGFRSMQIFASSPGAWKPPVLTVRNTEDLMRARATHEVDPLVIHAIYLINLASADPELVRRSIRSLVATLEAAEAMGAAGVVTHIGSHGGRGFESVAGQVAAGFSEIVERATGSVPLLLENSAGAGGIIGSQMEELGDLLDRAGRHPRLGIALDTAHLAGAGWDFAHAGESSCLADEVDRTVGLDRLAVVHANDSAVPVGSRRDRHANIGEGHIGLPGFRHLLEEPRLRVVPWIMETPDLGERETGKRVGSLERLLALANGREEADDGG